MGHAVDLADQQASLGGVPKVKLHHILFRAADIGGLGCSVDYMAAVAGQFFDDVSAGFQPRHGEAAVGRGLVGPDDRAACSAGASQILYLKYCALHGLTGHAVVLPDDQRRERGILKGQCFTGAGLDIDLLRGFLYGIAWNTLQLRHLVPAVTQAGENKLAILICIESPEVVDLSTARIVAGIGHAEFGPLQRIAGDAANLVDGQAGLFMVFKIDRMIPI